MIHLWFKALHLGLVNWLHALCKLEGGRDQNETCGTIMEKVEPQRKMWNQEGKCGTTMCDLNWDYLVNIIRRGWLSGSPEHVS